MTLTELLTVVAVITILLSMMSPVLIRAYREAGRRRCMANLAQIHTGLQLIANDNFGKLPTCYETKKSGNVYIPKEATWWYRKVAKVMYPHGKYDGTAYDHLTVPDSKNESWWHNAAAAGAPLQRFDPEYTIFRCPASLDMHEESRQPQWKPRTSGIDKDRVFDDNYGYNNYGFTYQGDQYGKKCTIYYKCNHGRFFEFSRLYHKKNNNGHGGYSPAHTIRGRYFPANHKNYKPYIGETADLYDPAGTVLMMDYVKPDIAPLYDVRANITVDGEKRYYGDGARFRHGGRANVLFADGHIEGFRDKIFRQAVAEGTTIHWTVQRTP